MDISPSGTQITAQRVREAEPRWAAACVHGRRQLLGAGPASPGEPGGAGAERTRAQGARLRPRPRPGPRCGAVSLLGGSALPRTCGGRACCSHGAPNVSSAGAHVPQSRSPKRLRCGGRARRSHGAPNLSGALRSPCREASPGSLTAEVSGQGGARPGEDGESQGETGVPQGERGGVPGRNGDSQGETGRRTVRAAGRPDVPRPDPGWRRS